MRLSPCHTVKIVNGFHGLPLPRAWPSLAHGLHGAIPLRRPVGGDGYVSRSPRTLGLGRRPSAGRQNLNTCLVQPHTGRASIQKLSQGM